MSQAPAQTSDWPADSVPPLVKDTPSGAPPQSTDWPADSVPPLVKDTTPSGAPPQSTDWPADSVPPLVKDDQPIDPASPPPNTGTPIANGNGQIKTVPLEKLKLEPQWVDCPLCKKQAQTKVQGRSDGKRKFMNVFWWPLPGRETWWEKTHWYCTSCNGELAMQKNGKELQVKA